MTNPEPRLVESGVVAYAVYMVDGYRVRFTRHLDATPEDGPTIKIESCPEGGDRATGAHLVVSRPDLTQQAHLLLEELRAR